MAYYDYLIIGSGIGGLYTALLAHKHGRTLIVTKGDVSECNTAQAQGGIAAALGQNDSPELHRRDTLIAGDGLSDEEAVAILTASAPDAIAELVALGVPFDTINGEIALSLEAGHSQPRVIHAGGDTTGAYIETTLSRQVRSQDIPVLEHQLVTDILTEHGRVRGVKLLDSQGTCTELECQYLVLATGGAGQLFGITTNSKVATADGIALAFRAGADITDAEFYQFHPTALHLTESPTFLISEAVRGEGAILRNIHGKRFMPEYTPQAELAPRDIVARSILFEMGKTGSEHVFLDLTHLPPKRTIARFPQIYHHCQLHGIDITRDWLPVAPAAHYTIGGIRVNLWGETNVPGLLATGEVACTGVHGANRLASNSLLEVMVFGRRLIERTCQNNPLVPPNTPPNTLVIQLPLHQAEPLKPGTHLTALQRLMWSKVGIVRDGDSLYEATQLLTGWHDAGTKPQSQDDFELSNLIFAGRIMAESALTRTESRGAHFRRDFPKAHDQWHRHIVFRRWQEGGPRD